MSTRSFALWILQQVIAVLASYVVAALIALVGHDIGLWVCLGAAPVAYLLARSEAFQAAALLVWVAPTFIFVIAFLDDASQHGMEMARNSYFASTVSDNDTLATILFTFPACACIAYSMGALLARFRNARIDGGGGTLDVRSSARSRYRL